jgi:hypothetical protein
VGIATPPELGSWPECAVNKCHKQQYGGDTSVQPTTNAHECLVLYLYTSYDCHEFDNMTIVLHVMTERLHDKLFMAYECDSFIFISR